MSFTAKVGAFMRTISFLNHKLRVEVDSDADQSVLEEIFFDRDYFRIEPFISAAKRGVLDVGAHKGFFILYARVFNPAVPIYAYEPEEKNFQALKKHLLENRTSGVFAKNLALAGEEGSLALHISEDSHNHTLLPVLPSFNERKINAVLLEKVLKKMGGCDLVKMDCEGAEFQILETAPDSVFFQVPVFFLEYHEFTPDLRVARLKTLFESKGFKVTLFPSRYDKRMGFLLAEKK